MIIVRVSCVRTNEVLTTGFPQFGQDNSGDMLASLRW
jgi:hypothetical protein